MTYHSLRDFLTTLKKKNLLMEVDFPTSVNLEITEIHTRLLKIKGPAVLFKNPLLNNGNLSSIPVLINLFGTTERIALGIGRTFEQLRQVGETLAFLKQPQPPTSLKDMAHVFPIIQTMLAMRPKKVNQAPCQEIIFTGPDIDLFKLPIQQCWPNEPGPLITWPLVVTKTLHPQKGEIYNLGVYRMQVIGKNKTIMRWLKHRGGAQHFQNWKATHKKKNLPCAVILGTDPATILAAVTPLPENISEYQFSGLLRKKKITLVPCKTIPLDIPANAEIVLEGHILLDTLENEGPYGDHTGYYNAVEKFPVFEICAITMRKNPIYLSTFTGRPPDEPSILGEALNEIFIPLLQQQFPEIIDFWLPPEGCSYRIAIVSIKKAYPGHGKRIMMGIWSFLRQFLYTKFIIVVDEDINCRDWKDVMWAVSTRMDPVRDITPIENTPIDYLDFASPENGLGGKLGLDATNKWPPETHRQWGEKIAMSQNMIDKVSKNWNNYGFKYFVSPIRHPEDYTHKKR